MFSSSYGYKWTIEEKVFGKNDEGEREGRRLNSWKNWKRRQG